MNFGPLTAKIGSTIWAPLANFNSFRVFAVLLHVTVVVGVRYKLCGVEQRAQPMQGDHHVRWTLAHILVFQRVWRPGSVTARHYWASAKLCGVEQREPLMFGKATITLGIGPHSSSSSFFSSPSLSGRRLDVYQFLPYFHTWCGLSANLECRV